MTQPTNEPARWDGAEEWMPLAWLVGNTPSGEPGLIFRDERDEHEAMLPNRLTFTPLGPIAAQPQAQPLTEDQALNCVLKIASNAPAVYLALCYETGPYQVDALRKVGLDLVRAIERAHGIGTEGGV